MRVIKDRFGCINPYNEVMAKRKDCEVIEDYQPPGTKKPRKPRAKKADTPAPADNSDLGALNELDPE